VSPHALTAGSGGNPKYVSPPARNKKAPSHESRQGGEPFGATVLRFGSGYDVRLAFARHNLNRTRGAGVLDIGLGYPVDALSALS
jgi:hypothetical protein